ncbi:MAG TPA: cupin domain-containing protein [Thermoleophilaceae bacterium]|nr:cupin domain-containing protein [Thermoleophilaceae bacterium]
MADYTRVNLRDDVQDMAPRFGMEGIESRFARTNLDMEKGGLSYFRLDPGFRAPFGHTHSEQEEVYVVVSGSARVAVGDDLIDMAQFDAVRVAPGAWRGMEAGPEGVEVIAFGAPNTDNKDAEMQQGWWPEG